MFDLILYYLGLLKQECKKDGKKNQWIVSLHPKGVNWYSERQYFWLKDKDKEQMIGRWKSRVENKWMYGVFEPDAKDPGNGLWQVFGYTKKDLDSQKNLSKKEKEKLFKLAKKESSEANKVFELLTKLQKKYYCEFYARNEQIVNENGHRNDIGHGHWIQKFRNFAALKCCLRIN